MYDKENAERIAERQSLYNKENAERIAERQSVYNKENAGWIAEKQMDRRRKAKSERSQKDRFSYFNEDIADGPRFDCFSCHC